VFRSAFVRCNQDVDVATIRVEAVCGFAACVRDVDHFAFDARRAIGGPAMCVVAGRE
jgi:hypothetical protein